MNDYVNSLKYGLKSLALMISSKHNSKNLDDLVKSRIVPNLSAYAYQKSKIKFEKKFEFYLIELLCEAAILQRGRNLPPLKKSPVYSSNIIMEELPLMLKGCAEFCKSYSTKVAWVDQIKKLANICKG